MDIFIVCSYLLSTRNAAIYQLISNDGPTLNQYYGGSTFITNDIAFVGAYGDNTWDGAVYVFSYNHSMHSWQQKQKLIPSIINGQFGWDIDYDEINGDLIIGAWNHNSSRGQAYIYAQNQFGNWTEDQILQPLNAAIDDQCGYSV
eukprot:260651_1